MGDGSPHPMRTRLANPPDLFSAQWDCPHGSICPVRPADAEWGERRVEVAIPEREGQLNCDYQHNINVQQVQLCI